MRVERARPAWPRSPASGSSTATIVAPRAARLGRRARSPRRRRRAGRGSPPGRRTPAAPAPPPRTRPTPGSRRSPSPSAPSCPTRSACAEQPVEHRPVRARLVRVAHLAEDLALARNERVEPGRDAEEVQRRGLVAQAVELDLARRATPPTRAPRPPRAPDPRGRARCGCRSRGTPPRRSRAILPRELRGPRRGRGRRARAPRRATGGARCRRGRGSCEVPHVQAELQRDRRARSRRASCTRRAGRASPLRSAGRGTRRRRPTSAR